MTKKLIIAAALCLLVGVVWAIPSGSPGPTVPCKYPGCTYRKGKIVDRDTVALVYLNGKMQHIHGYHVLPRYKK